MAKPVLLILANVLSVLARESGVRVESRVTTRQAGKVCSVTANGNKVNDVPNIRKAFEECNNGGTVVFPEGQNYWIGEVFNPVLTNVHIEWRGQWTLSDDLDYWRNHTVPIGYFNLAAGLIFSGERVSIDGHGTGGVWGNGDAWWDAEQGKTQKGRPQPFLVRNATDLSVSNFFVRQSPMWSINVMFSKRITFDNILVNNTATHAPPGANWVGNTDGFDTIDSDSVSLSNFAYVGGDDCIAVKERSYNVYVRNVTCYGGNGVAIGSLGAYQVDSSVENVTMTDIKLPGTNHGIYVKIWMGVPQPPTNYEADGKDQGGGFGTVKNLHFSNVNVTNNKEAFRVTQNHGDGGPNWGTSKMAISHFYYSDFYGILRPTDGNAEKPQPVNCSSVHPCHDMWFKDLEVYGITGKRIKGTCNNTTRNGVHGLPGCSACAGY